MQHVASTERAVSAKTQSLGQQLLPVICCLMIQALWLGVIHSLEGVVGEHPSRFEPGKTGISP